MVGWSAGTRPAGSAAAGPPQTLSRDAACATPKAGFYQWAAYLSDVLARLDAQAHQLPPEATLRLTAAEYRRLDEVRASAIWSIAHMTSCWPRFDVQLHDEARRRLRAGSRGLRDHGA